MVYNFFFRAVPCSTVYCSTTYVGSGYVRTIKVCIGTTYVGSRCTYAQNGTAGSTAGVIEGILQQWRYCIRHYRGKLELYVLHCIYTTYPTATTYRGHPVDTVSLQTAWERRLSLTVGGGTVGELRGEAYMLTWEHCTGLRTQLELDDVIHTLSFGTLYAFSTENIMWIKIYTCKWKSIKLSPTPSNSNNNQRTNSLIGIQKTFVAHIFYFQCKKKFFYSTVKLWAMFS